MNERGEYRGIYTVLIESPEYLALKTHARLMLFVLKLKLGPSGIGVIPGMIGALAEATGCNALQTADALSELEATGWVKTEGNVAWVINGLKYEPAISGKNANHRSSVLTYLNTLPRLKIVDEFRRHYADWLQIEPPEVSDEQREVEELVSAFTPEKAVVRKPKEKPSSWVAEGTQWWQDNVGTINHGRFGTACTGLVARFGWDRVFAAVREYVDSVDAGKARIEWFAANGVRLVEGGGKKQASRPQWQIEQEDEGLARAPHVAQYVKEYKLTLNGKGDEWWKTMIAQAKSRGRHPVVYAYEIAKQATTSAV